MQLQLKTNLEKIKKTAQTLMESEGGKNISFEEKPIARSHINAGVYALDPAALRLLGADMHCDMPSLFERLKAHGQRTVAYPMHEPWLDVGRPEDYRGIIDGI